MKQLLLALVMIGLLAAPGLAQGRLPAPNVTAIAISDMTSYGLGWCLTVQWDAVEDAHYYDVRFRGKKGKEPRWSNGNPSRKARWRISEAISTDGYDVSVMQCWLDQSQQVIFRLRAIDYDNFANQIGKPTKRFSVRLPKFNSAPVLPRFGVPAIEVYGSLG